MDGPGLAKREGMESGMSLPGRIYRFYIDGFRNMPGWGRKVWIIILIKLVIMFAILKIFFFQDFLETKFNNDKQKSEYVLDQLLNSPVTHD